ncbi:Stress-related protein [Platanthera zijinensis]|uniref:Stress-related protein n=1 Tax=Platanthera zijinensis TaxID=2320716 RepID=A0AAP0FZJ4_9ASPA
MATSETPSDEIERSTRLKHLDFVLVIAVQTVVFLSSLYNFSKENAGPLRAGVQAVEDTVKAVVGPVYENILTISFQLLNIIDRKIDDLVGEAERHVPSVLKKATAGAYAAAQQAPQALHSVIGEVQGSGVTATSLRLLRAAKKKYGPVARHAYERHGPTIERRTAAAWHSLNQLPIVPQIAHIAVPTAAYWAEKYNKAVGQLAESGYAVTEFLPLVPTERIAKVFGKDVNPTASSQSPPRMSAAAASQ